MCGCKERAHQRRTPRRLHRNQISFIRRLICAGIPRNPEVYGANQCVLKRQFDSIMGQRVCGREECEHQRRAPRRLGGIKSSFSKALFCAIRRRITPNASTNQPPSKDDFIAVWGQGVCGRGERVHQRRTPRRLGGIKSLFSAASFCTMRRWITPNTSTNQLP